MTIDADGADGAEHTIEHAAALFERIMGSDNGAAQTGEEDEVENAESDELEADMDDEAEGDDEAPEQGDEDDEGEESDPDDDESELTERELNRKVPVKNPVTGQTEYLTIRELQEGNLRWQDYTRKTQQIAEEKRVLAEQAAQLEAVRQERAYYQQVLEAQQRKLVEEFQPLTDEQWRHLRETDPLEYTIRKQDMHDRQQAYAQAEAQKQYLMRMAQQEQHQAFDAARNQGFETLYQHHPEWKDQKVWARVKGDILEYGLSVGYSKEELTSATDGRAVLTLYNAMMADKVRKAKPVRTNSDQQKAPKPLPASSATANKPRAKTELANARQRLSKSGSVQDAADVFLKGGFI